MSIDEIGTYLIISAIVLVFYNRILILLHKYKPNIIKKFKNQTLNKIILIIKTLLLTIVIIHFLLNIINQGIWLDKIIIIEILIYFLLYPKIWCNKLDTNI